LSPTFFCASCKPARSCHECIVTRQAADVAADIDAELSRLDKLYADAEAVKDALSKEAEHVQWLQESLALKLHNFYTGCERIFQIIATELNGGLPCRAERLQAFLGFRHVVRHSYGFELDPVRLRQLADE
jgi:hypothetical protein